MCAINFIWAQPGHPEKPKLMDALDAMNAASIHRGPDMEGSWLHHFANGSMAVMGSQRLAITDPTERGRQPMTAIQGRYALVFNGEIYNYFDLRNQLGPYMMDQGLTFESQTDTEVLLYWLLANGAEGLAALEGMFAFVLLDTSTGEVLLARDRWGMKPLAVYWSEGLVLIASETQAIVASGLVARELNVQMVASYLPQRFGSLQYSFFEGINYLAPGLMGRGTLGGELVCERLPQQRLEKPTPTLEALEEALIDALLMTFSPDSRTGLFLSGGVDSTLLLALAREQGQLNFPSFTLAHAREDEAFGTRDAHFARQAAKQYDMPLEVLTVGRDALDELPNYVAQLDQPVADSGGFLTWLLARQAKRYVSTVMSGAGADELFGGYHRHAAFGKYLQKRVFLLRAAPLLKGVAGMLPTGFAHPWRKRLQLYKKGLGRLHSDPAATFQTFSMLPLGQLPQPEHTGLQPGQVEGWLEWALRHDQHFYLPGDVLAVNDMAGMGQHMELRMPYLHAPVVAWARHNAVGQLLAHGPKAPLRSLLLYKGGGAYVKRRKEGFGLPWGHWLHNAQWRKRWEPCFLQPHPAILKAIPQEAITALWRRHIHKRADHSLELWSLLVLHLWLSHHFGA